MVTNIIKLSFLISFYFFSLSFGHIIHEQDKINILNDNSKSIVISQNKVVKPLINNNILYNNNIIKYPVFLKIKNILPYNIPNKIIYKRFEALGSDIISFLNKTIIRKNEINTNDYEWFSNPKYCLVYIINLINNTKKRNDYNNYILQIKFYEDLVQYILNGHSNQYIQTIDSYKELEINVMRKLNGLILQSKKSTRKLMDRKNIIKLGLIAVLCLPSLSNNFETADIGITILYLLHLIAWPVVADRAGFDPVIFGLLTASFLKFVDYLVSGI